MFLLKESTNYGVFGVNATMEKLRDLKNHQGRRDGKKDRIFVFQGVQNDYPNYPIGTMFPAYTLV
jgi:hypothetical protein